MKDRLQSFYADSRGSMSIEFAIWLPFLCFLLVIVIDTTYLYLGQNQMWAAARDAARRLSDFGNYKVSEGQGVIDDTLTRLANNGGDFHYSVKISQNPSDVEVVVTVPMDNVMPFGIFKAVLSGDDIVARVVMPKR